MNGSLEINDIDLKLSHDIEKMINSEAWKYLQEYVAAQWEMLVEDVTKCRTEPNWRSQQGKLKGFKLCWDIPFKIISRAGEEIKARQAKSEEGQNEGYED